MSFSVITVNFNDAIGLERTIISVISQTYRDYEYVIIDGGSTDGSLDIIKKYNDYITYWVSEKDRGIYHAMNKGVAEAHGDYCIFMNSGDSFYDDEVLKCIADYKICADIVVGRIISNENGHVLFAAPQQKLSLYYLYSGTIPHQSSFIKTELLRQFPYDENLKIVSDWKFYIQAVIIQNCSVKYVDDYVTIFDLGGISTSNPEEPWKEKSQVLSSMFPHRILVDYKRMKASECLTYTLAPQLRQHYYIDKILFRLGMILLKCIKK